MPMREVSCSSGGHPLKAYSLVEGGSQPGAEEPHQTRSQESCNQLEKEFQKEDTDADVMDLATQVQLKLSTQLEWRVRDPETATCCTLFVPKKSEIVTDLQNAGKLHSDMATNHTGKERGRPHIWFFNAMSF